jgi:hypothetical protein
MDLTTKERSKGKEFFNIAQENDDAQLLLC